MMKAFPSTPIKVWLTKHGSRRARKRLKLPPGHLMGMFRLGLYVHIANQNAGHQVVVLWSAVDGHAVTVVLSAKNQIITCYRPNIRSADKRTHKPHTPSPHQIEMAKVLSREFIPRRTA